MPPRGSDSEESHDRVHPTLKAWLKEGILVWEQSQERSSGCYSIGWWGHVVLGLLGS